MPAIVPSYVYMFVAMTAVGTLLIFSVNSYVSTLRFVPETEQLDNLLNHVAARATELLSGIQQDSTTKLYLNLPTKIGNRPYWLRLHNDTLRSWVEGGFGTAWNVTTSYKLFLPGNPIVEGHHVSVSGPVILKGFMNSQAPQLFLISAREDSN